MGRRMSKGRGAWALPGGLGRRGYSPRRPRPPGGPPGGARGGRPSQATEPFGSLSCGPHPLRTPGDGPLVREGVWGLPSGLPCVPSLLDRWGSNPGF